MSSPLPQKIEAINGRIRTLLAETQRALAGEHEFGVEQVRALAEPIQEMAPLMAREADLRTVQPETAAALDLYKAQLRELQTALERVRMMLLARRAQIEGGVSIKAPGPAAGHRCGPARPAYATMGRSDAAPATEIASRFAARSARYTRHI